MPNSVADISADAIYIAAERLNRIGVFADEDRNYPSVSAFRLGLADLDVRLRLNGYTGGPIAIEYLDHQRDAVDFVIYDSAKITDVRSAESAWYLDYRNRWHAKVTARVDDWVNRLQNLRSSIQSWLPNDMSIVDRPPTRMREELMQKFNVPSANMPTFEVVKGSERLMRIQPKGLWIIGANGRVDLVTANGSWILIDKSPPLSQTPNWHLYSSSKQQPSVKLDQTQFVGLL